ncbi:hypothetical protein [Shimia biformata]|nr:hypothetical protein [Shimia biformata]
MTRILVLLTAFLALTACETAKGVGKDVGKAGDIISDTATKVQKQF